MIIACEQVDCFWVSRGAENNFKHPATPIFQREIVLRSYIIN